MKSIAVSAAVVAALATAAPAPEPVQCTCARPPGGVARCESNQAALCNVSNGTCDARCFTIRKESGLFGRAQDPALAAAILSSLLGEKVTRDEVRSDLARQTMKKLLDGRVDSTH